MRTETGYQYGDATLIRCKWGQRKFWRVLWKNQFAGDFGSFADAKRFAHSTPDKFEFWLKIISAGKI